MDSTGHTQHHVQRFASEPTPCAATSRAATTREGRAARDSVSAAVVATTTLEALLKPQALPAIRDKDAFELVENRPVVSLAHRSTNNSHTSSSAHASTVSVPAAEAVTANAATAAVPKSPGSVASNGGTIPSGGSVASLSSLSRGADDTDADSDRASSAGCPSPPLTLALALRPPTGSGLTPTDAAVQDSGSGRSATSSPASQHGASPLPFNQLQEGVDLKRPPPNWLQSHLPDGTLVPAGVDSSLPDDDAPMSFQALARENGSGRRSGSGHGSQDPYRHESLSMVGALAMQHVGPEVDVVAPVDAMKQLFRMPYSHEPLSLAVHSVGHTLILDTVEQGTTPQSVLGSITADVGGGSPNLFVPAAVRPSQQVRKQELFSKFLYRTLLPPAGATQPQFVAPPHGQQGPPALATHADVPSPPAQGAEDTASTGSPDVHGAAGAGGPGAGAGAGSGAGSSATSRQGPSANTGVTAPAAPSEPPVAQGDTSTSALSSAGAAGSAGLSAFSAPGSGGAPASRPFRQVSRWSFNGMNMVLGSDLIVFGNDQHKRVSLQLQDVDEQPMTQADGLNMFLDNVMANVPEVAMCFHKAGVVKGYRLVPTQEIPSLVKESFSPYLLEQNAAALLQFLRENCVSVCGTYWLWRGEGETRVQLYDLSDLSSSRMLRWKYMMAMLCYRYASQLGREKPAGSDATQHSDEAVPPGRRPRSKSLGNAPIDLELNMRLQGRRRALLAKCGELLEEVHQGGGRSHLTIRAAVHQELAQSFAQQAADLTASYSVPDRNRDANTRSTRKGRKAAKRHRRRTRVSSPTTGARPHDVHKSPSSVPQHGQVEQWSLDVPLSPTVRVASDTGSAAGSPASQGSPAAGAASPGEEFGTSDGTASSSPTWRNSAVATAVSSLNYAARHVLQGMEALRSVSKEHADELQALQASEYQEGPDGAAEFSFASSADANGDSNGMDDRKEAEEEAKAALEAAALRDEMTASKFADLKANLVTILKSLCELLSKAGRPVTALRALDDGIGSLRSPLAQGLAKLPVSRVMDDNTRADLLELVGNLAMQISVSKQPKHNTGEGAAPAANGDAPAEPNGGAADEAKARDAEPRDTHDEGVELGRLRNVFAALTEELGGTRTRRNGPKQGKNGVTLPTALAGGAATGRKLTSTPTTAVDFLYMATRCYEMVAAVHFRRRAPSEYIVSVRRFGDAVNRWGQMLLNRGEHIAAAEVFSSGVEVFELVDDKENAALLMCNIVHILRLLGLRSTQSDLAEAANKAAGAASPKRVAKSTAPASELVKAALMPSVGAAALFDTAVTLCTRAYNSLSKKKHGSVRRRVTEELAQCYLSQGVCLARSPRMLESDDLQRQSHQLLAKALSLYKDAGNRKQAAACHYQLGHSFFLIVQRAASGAYVSPERLRMALNSATSHFDQAMNGYRGAGEELELCDTLLVIVKDYTAVFALIAKLNGGNIAGRIGALDGALRTLSLVARMFRAVPAQSPAHLVGTDQDVSQLWRMARDDMLPNFRDLLRRRVAASKAACASDGGADAPAPSEGGDSLASRECASLKQWKAAYLTALTTKDAHGVVDVQAAVDKALACARGDGGGAQ